MNENLSHGQPLPVGVVQGFKRLADLFHKQDLLVTTSARLLQYAALAQTLRLDIQQRSGLIEVHLSFTSDFSIERENLQGLTLYCENPERTALYWKNEKLTVRINPVDASGKESLTIPWRPLEFPF